MFVYYGANALGFSHCLPIIGLDDIYLRVSKYLGILRTAIALDANGSLFPIIYAVVDVENDDNWLWFLRTHRSVFEKYTPQFLEFQSTSLTVLTLLSDRQKGLIEGVASVFEHTPHGHCLRYLEENFHKQFSYKELKRLLWTQAARVS
jgi:hypothetical protein